MGFSNAIFDPVSPAAVGPGDGDIEYVYQDPRISLAINVALATSRPLLVRGPAGSGKSSLASDVARRLGWSYIETVMTSRTRLSDLVAEVDLVRRLNDAQAHVLQTEYEYYLIPGVLWWAFDPDSARRAPLVGGERLTRPEWQNRGIVVLLDEIDKAEPDLPNDLLGPLGGAGIEIPFQGTCKPLVPLLMIVTSNGERDMPPAFLRRCLNLELGYPTESFLIAVATKHYGQRSDNLYGKIARRMLELYDESRREGQRPPSTAEFLDTVVACVRFNIEPSSELWQSIETVTLMKRWQLELDNDST